MHPDCPSLDDYDALPYPSLPFPDTQPSHLAALAALFGIAAADVVRARTLELGCAAGGNIIPLAVRFPAARFVGIDLSRQHVDEGIARIGALGLTNIELRHADLEKFDPGGQQFDYVICNGVFSWVPPTTQEAILRLCQRVLAPDGMATISYNVLPGWHLRMVVRDICRNHAGTGSPVARVAKARGMLERLAAGADPATPYGSALRLEAARLRAVPDAYVNGEFLAQTNAPMFFGDFATFAGRFGLQYLCEADLRMGAPNGLEPSTRAALFGFGPDRIAAEQHIDELTGRLFRRSVLVPQRAVAGRVPSPVLKRLSSLHVSSALRVDKARTTAQETVFVDRLARPISVRLPALVQALSELGAAFPASVAVRRLVDCACSDATRSRLARALLDIVLAGRASLSVLPVQIGRSQNSSPKLWSLARLEAAAAQPWLTSLRHEAVPIGRIGRFGRAVLPLLAAGISHAALQKHFLDGLRDGTLTDDPELTMDALLAQLEQDALLEFVGEREIAAAEPPRSSSAAASEDGIGTRPDNRSIQKGVPVKPWVSAC